MTITKRQLDDILRRINERFMGFSHEALGPRALTDDEMAMLRRSGVLRAGTRNMVADPAAFGRLTAMLPLSASTRITYEDLKRMIREGAVGQTRVEATAIEYAEEHAGEYIRGLRDSMLRDARAGRARASMSVQRAIQEGVTQAIAKRQTVSELKTALFDAIDSKGRDWHRVAQTEINNALQHGVYRRIREVSEADEEQKVFKRPAPDACPWCKKLYLAEDGITPKIFKMRDLADSNHGLKAQNWLPTIGSVHPYCFTDGRTDVFTVDGWKMIKDIKVGELVLSHKGKFRRVKWIMPSRRARDEGIVSFRVDDGSKTSRLRTRMRVTEDHLFLTTDGWVKARDLEGKRVVSLAKKCRTCGSFLIWSQDEREYCSKACASVDKTKACHTDAAHEKIGRSMIRQYHSGERRVNVEAAHRETRKMFKEGRHPFQEVDFYHRLNSGMKKRSFLERKVEWLLKSKGLEFKANSPVARDRTDRLGRVRYFFPDFILKNKIIIECDGEHWHEFFRDFRRDKELKSLGYTTLRFKGDDILNNFKKVTSKIERVVNNHDGNYLFHEFAVIEFKHNPNGNSIGLYDFEVEEDHSFVARGVVSHNCRCQLSVVPKGYEFKKMSVANEPFEFDDFKFKTGELIPDEIFGRLGSLKDKTRKEAILSYEG